jgi:hypothetical protein
MAPMVAPGDFGLSPRHFRIRGRHEMVELTQQQQLEHRFLVGPNLSILGNMVLSPPRSPLMVTRPT